MKNTSLARLILRLVLPQILLGGFLAIVMACLTLIGPLTIKAVITFLKLKNPTQAQHDVAYSSAVLWAVLFLLKIFVHEYA